MIIKESEHKPGAKQHWLEVREAPYGYVIQEYWMNDEDFPGELFPERWSTHRVVVSGNSTDSALLRWGISLMSIQCPFVIEDKDFEVVDDLAHEIAGEEMYAQHIKDYPDEGCDCC